MKVSIASLADPVVIPDGAVVVIDVLRAFSTAAYALAAGAREILLATEVEEALRLRDATHRSQVMGEVNGIFVPQFDYGNSPQEFLNGRPVSETLIQRTTAGTRGAALYRTAPLLFAGSFVCAGATVEQLLAFRPAEVRFVITGDVHGGDGDEDRACAEYLAECLLTGSVVSPAPFLARVATSSWGRQFGDPAYPHFPAGDIPLCSALDRFPFAMRIAERGDALVLTRS